MLCSSLQLINQLARTACQAHLPKPAAHVWCCLSSFCVGAFFFLFLSCVLGQWCCCVCCLARPPVKQTPMNFAALPSASCLQCIVGKLADCSLVSWGCQVGMSVAGFFKHCRSPPLSPLWSPRVFRGLVWANWSIYTPCVSSISPLWLVKV